MKIKLNYKNLLVKNNLINYGIEREAVRIDENLVSVNTPHPFDNKFENKHITIDFSEQQIELITGVHNSLEKTFDEIKILTNILYKHMNKNEILWNYSIPLKDISKNTPALGKNEHTKYRNKLLKRSSLKEQLISGIHFNWSISDELFSKHNDFEINEFYFKIFNLYSRVSYILKNMYGFSQTKDFKEYKKLSWRQDSKEGYNSKKVFGHANYKEYRKDINKRIKKGEFISWRNIFSDARVKPHNCKKIKWVEVRNIDTCYFNKYGLHEELFVFLNSFILFLSDQDKDAFLNLQEDTLDNSYKILKTFKTWLKKYNVKHLFLDKYVRDFKNKKAVKHPKPKKAEIAKQQIQLRNKYLKNDFALEEIKDLELSTQILIEDAYLQNFDVEIISKEKNIVKFNNTLIEKATLNPFDSKVGLEIIDDKIKTNIFLKENDFSGTNQNIYSSYKKAIKEFEKYKNKKIVIKPTTTNFSQGLTIFKKTFSKEDFNKALKFAFSFDKKILVEDFIEGNEYRFLIINNKLVGVLQRIPANVEGDGKNNIRELIKIKNQNYLRGINYKKPLEKIKIGEIEKQFLKQNNVKLTDVPKAGEKIFFRENSNVSTGGDTIDVTDLVHPKYIKIALKATKLLGLYVCGLDIIINDLSNFKNYTILEMNWNPAIHIHTYPLIGKNRRPASYVLEIIKKKEK